jgi:hypothetical protein
MTLNKHSADVARKKHKSANSDRRSVVTVALGAKTPARYVGTLWDAVDWSCAYDAVIVLLFHTLRTHPVAFGSAVQHMTQFMSHLVVHFHHLSRRSEDLQAQLNNIRNSLRDMLSSASPNNFPRRGAVPIGAFDVLYAICGPSSIEGVGDIVCSTCQLSQLRGARSTQPLGHFARPPLVQFTRILDGADPGPRDLAQSPISFAHWLRAFTLNSVSHLSVSSVRDTCGRCSTPAPHVFTFDATSAPRLFFVDVSDWTLSTSPQLTLQFSALSGCTLIYRLCGAIYHGTNHWTCRWISRETQVWAHDGRLHRGKLVAHGKARVDSEDGSASAGCSLGSMQDSTLSILIYASVYEHVK